VEGENKNFAAIDGHYNRVLVTNATGCNPPQNEAYHLGLLIPYIGVDGDNIKMNIKLNGV
jgi:hypothetical protein